jgi:hypothetical protein
MSNFTIRVAPATAAGSGTAAKEGPESELTTDGSGRVRLDGPGNWNVRVPGDEFRRMERKKGPIAVEGEVEIWVYRRVMVRGTVRLESGDPTPGDGVRILGYPSADPPKGGGSPADVIGSRQWTLIKMGRKANWKDHPWSADVSNGAYEVECPALDHVSVVAAAPGYTSESVVLDFRGVPDGTARADFLLRKARSWKFRVVDEEGKPLPAARVQVVRLEKVPSAEAKVGEHAARGSLGRTGASSWSCGETGITTFSHKSVGSTDKDGNAEIFDASSSEPGERQIFVSLEGYQPRHLPEAYAESYRDSPIVLRRVSGADGYIQLTNRGVPLKGDCRVSAYFTVDEAISTGGAGEFTVRGGRLSRNAFEAGQTYLLFVNADGLGMRSGRVTFGSKDTLDVSEIDVDPAAALEEIRKEAERKRK